MEAMNREDDGLVRKAKEQGRTARMARWATQSVRQNMGWVAIDPAERMGARKLRLAAVACARAVLPFTSHPRMEMAVAAAQSFATEEDPRTRWALVEGFRASRLQGTPDQATAHADWMAHGTCSSSHSDLINIIVASSIGDTVLSCLLGNPYARGPYDARDFPSEAVRLAEFAYSSRDQRRACSQCYGVRKIQVFKSQPSHRLFPDEFFQDGGTYDTEMKACPFCNAKGWEDHGRLEEKPLLILADWLEENGLQKEPCPMAYGKGRHKSPPLATTTPWACDVCHGDEFIPDPLVAHLRAPVLHWPGCWAVDKVMGTGLVYDPLSPPKLDPKKTAEPRTVAG